MGPSFLYERASSKLSPRHHPTWVSQGLLARHTATQRIKGGRRSLLTPYLLLSCTLFTGRAVIGAVLAVVSYVLLKMVIPLVTRGTINEIDDILIETL